jgi:hypothetical protein
LGKGDFNEQGPGPVEGFPFLNTKFQDSMAKGRVWGYKAPVGQAKGVSDTLAVRINLLWSGHIAAETY